MFKYILLSIISLGCSDPSNNNKIYPQPGEDLCGQACDNLKQLSCTIDNCLSKCIEDHRNGYFWNTYCLINIETCDEIQLECKSIFSKQNSK